MRGDTGWENTTYGCNVTKLILLAGENLSQYPSHNLATSGLGQIRNDIDGLGCGKRTDALANLHDEFLAESIIDYVNVLDCHKRIDSLASEFISNTHDGSFSNSVVLDEGSFNLGRGETVARNVDNVIDSAADPVETFVVTTSTVTSELRKC